MGITTYEENGQTYYKVYVNARSRTDKTRRMQRTVKGLKSENEARREERKLIRYLSSEIQKHDNKGLDWKDILHLWSVEIKKGYLGHISDRSVNEYISIVHKWTGPWMKRVAADITRADARELIMLMERHKVARSYQKKIKNIINKVYDWGIEFKHIKGVENSPLKGLIIDKGEERVPDILTLEEIKKFLSTAQALDHKWYPIWSFAILTGMRSGELHALTWDQIDLEKGLILVDRSYDSNTKNIGPTKARYWRTIPINNSLRRLIMDIRKSSEKLPCNHVLPRIKDWDNGDQAVPLKGFLKSINVKPIKFHALRACFATQMLANGVPAPVVMKIGGWKKTATMDIYLRLAGVDIQGATDCLEFVPSEIDFGGNVVNLFDRRGKQ